MPILTVHTHRHMQASVVILLGIYIALFPCCIHELMKLYTRDNKMFSAYFIAVVLVANTIAG